MPASKDATSRRPRALHTSRSFSRFESPPPSPSKRTRASTFQEPGLPQEFTNASSVYCSLESEPRSRSGDLFETRGDDDISTDLHASHDINDQLWRGFDELPLEIKELTERFIDSLSNKVHPASLAADRLSELFQDFYIRADSLISTHISTLASLLSRKTAPSTSDQQMLTASEITYMRKARRQAEVKRLSLEEAVERAACKQLYGSIWRIADDELRDEKLRGIAAALLVLGIGLRELRVDSAEGTSGTDLAAKEDEIRHHLGPARDSLMKMNEEKYPAGKLQQLTTAHKRIVDTLSRFFPADSSADEILPAFIYTLITSSSEEPLNIISNLNFIQRFRNGAKIDGEAAWCLTNAEAAVSFLETLSLSSLRASESPAMPDRPMTSRIELPNAPGLGRPASPSVSAISATSTELSPAVGSHSVTPLFSAPHPVTLKNPAQQRRSSGPLASRNNRIESASDALLKNADQAFDTINATLENSFNFLFGRLREQQSLDTQGSPVVVPKTLKDARRLVSTPPPQEDDVDTGTTTSGIENPLPESMSKAESRMLDLVGGRRATRERSADSSRSTVSGKKVSFAGTNEPSGDRPKMPSPSTSLSPSPPVPATHAAVESMRNLGNTLNPLNRLASMNKAWGFGRSTPPATELVEKTKQQLDVSSAVVDPPQPSGAFSSVTKEISEEAARATLIKLCKSGPPIQRFVEMKDPKQMTLGDAEELLKDYQRLAVALEQAGLS